MNEKNNFNYRYSRYNWVAVDAFRDNLPFARTDWERPNYTTTASWTSTLTSNLINELTYTYSKDNVFINVFTENGAHERSRYGINYPYIFQEKEIVDKIPTITFGSGGFQTIDGGPYPASSAGPIHTVSNTTTWVRGRHTFKAGVSVEYSGEDDFDQINVSPVPGSTNNQNGRFEFLDNRAGGTGLGHRQRSAGPVQQLRRARPAQLHQVALAGDRCLHPGFVEADEPDDHRRRRAVGVLAAVVLDDEQHLQLRSAVLRSGAGGDHQPRRRAGGSESRAATTASCCRATGSKATAARD